MCIPSGAHILGSWTWGAISYNGTSGELAPYFTKKV
jgi:hypothetical protein